MISLATIRSSSGVWPAPGDAKRLGRRTPPSRVLIGGATRYFLEQARENPAVPVGLRRANSGRGTNWPMGRPNRNRHGTIRGKRAWRCRQQGRPGAQYLDGLLAECGDEAARHPCAFSASRGRREHEDHDEECANPRRRVGSFDQKTSSSWNHFGDGVREPGLGAPVAALNRARVWAGFDCSWTDLRLAPLTVTVSESSHNYQARVRLDIGEAFRCCASRLVDAGGSRSAPPPAPRQMMHTGEVITGIGKNPVADLANQIAPGSRGRAPVPTTVGTGGKSPTRPKVMPRSLPW